MSSYAGWPKNYLGTSELNQAWSDDTDNIAQ